MRQNFEKILGEELRYLAIKTRERFNLTQREMSEQLQMGESSYSDIETGETICASALTETLLLCMHNNPDEFLNRISERFEEALQLYSDIGILAFLRGILSLGGFLFVVERL